MTIDQGAQILEFSDHRCIIQASYWLIKPRLINVRSCNKITMYTLSIIVTVNYNLEICHCKKCHTSCKYVADTRMAAI